MSFAYLIWTSLEKVERKSIILIPEKNNSCYVLNTQKNPLFCLTDITNSDFFYSSVNAITTVRFHVQIKTMFSRICI